MVNFASLNVGLSAMQTQLAALQTIGHNIANASDPNYSRQRVQTSNLLPNDMQFGQLGNGVQVDSIQRIVDQTVELQLRDSLSNLGSKRVAYETFAQIEAIFNELTEGDISTQLNEFFNAVDDLANNPDDIPTRQIMIEEANKLTQTIGFVYDKMRELREGLNADVEVQVDQINQLTAQIASLNEQILTAENGGHDLGTANDLRDRRDTLIREMSEIIDINVVETSKGEANILAGGEHLVFGTRAFTLDIRTTIDRGSEIVTPFIQETGARPPLYGGTLEGIMTARDEISVSFMDDLNELANAMIFEFNQVHSEGFGLSFYNDLTSAYSVSDNSLNTLPLTMDGSVTRQGISTTFTDASLVGQPDLTGQQVVFTEGPNKLQSREIVGFDSTTGTIQFDRPFDTKPRVGDTYQVTGMEFPIQNGSFNFEVVNSVTGSRTTTNIHVDLDGVGADTTLEDIRATIDGLSGISAQFDSENRMRITTASPDIQFGFSDDSSGFLASMGLNVFFSGTGAEDMQVAQDIQDDPSRLAAARSLNAGDNTNALALAGLRDAQVLNGDSESITEFYQGIAGRLAIQARGAQDTYENQEVITQQIENQRQRISGVNLDEEAANLIVYQRAFQASARYITVIDQLLDTLINGTI